MGKWFLFEAMSRADSGKSIPTTVRRLVVSVGKSILVNISSKK